VDWDDAYVLAPLDAKGYTVLEAVTMAPLPASASHSKPNAVVCVDGGTYWAKGSVQQGLVAELIAGRLAAEVGVGPIARIIRTTKALLPADGSANHILGVVVGSRDMPGVANARDLQTLLGGQPLPAGSIDASSRAKVTAFHTWLGMGDAQVLVNLTDGKVWSIDHGECFGAVSTPTPIPTIVAVDIPGTDPDLGREKQHVLPAIDAIEAVTDAAILNAISQIPSADEWRSPVARRLSIGRWLAERRQTVRGVMEAWMKK